MSTTLQGRIRPSVHKSLREIADTTQTSLQDALECAVEEYRRKVFFQDVNAAFARLKSDPAAWDSLTARIESIANSVENIDDLIRKRLNSIRFV